MPGKYRKRSYGKRRGGQRRIARTKKLVTGQQQPTLLEKIASGVGSAAKVATAVLPMIKAINTEQKFIDLATGAVNISSTPSFWNLCLMGTGTDEQSRIGNSILLKDFNLRISFTPNYTGTAYNYFRMTILVDKMQNGTPPTATQLFQAPTNLDSAFNRNTSDRFVILKDKRFVIAQQGDQLNVIQKIYKKLDFHARYLGTPLVASSAGPNAVYLMLWGTATVNFPTASIYNRTNYTDN